MLPPLIKTNRFVLKAYEPHDEDLFIEIVLDPESQRFMGGVSADESQERALFRKIFDIYTGQQERWLWIWGIYEAGQLCGHIELKQSEHTNDEELEIVYMIHPKQRRRGVLTEVLEVFKQQQGHWNKKMIATVSSSNTISVAALQRWGIERKIVLKDAETQEQYYKLYLTDQ